MPCSFVDHHLYLPKYGKWLEIHPIATGDLFILNSVIISIILEMLLSRWLILHQSKKSTTHSIYSSSYPPLIPTMTAESSENFWWCCTKCRMCTLWKGKGTWLFTGACSRCISSCGLRVRESKIQWVLSPPAYSSPSPKAAKAGCWRYSRSQKHNPHSWGRSSPACRWGHHPFRWCSRHSKTCDTTGSSSF